MSSEMVMTSARLAVPSKTRDRPDPPLPAREAPFPGKALKSFQAVSSSEKARTSMSRQRRAHSSAPFRRSVLQTMASSCAKMIQMASVTKVFENGSQRSTFRFKNLISKTNTNYNNK
ncbi:hypothetical protein QR680_017404 [Steinernema hermaphroditum]|uniref:Uncharacterized protein n=1 Tax=Steinernema hermaphroditum TaxID=289476 RepID=A0AA39HFG2_9BILA|nr:hypothetical protein QR680_017404 [Steinernema hermaphroditum]